jgi:peptidoglycan/LPS O-acetylase OafA/YrhL
MPLSTITYFRIDDILAGCTLALAYHGRLGEWLPRRIGQIPQGMALILLFLSCLVQAEWLNYLRPYLAAALIGATIVNSRTAMTRLLDGRVLAYLAAISYALYVWHPLLAASWLGSGAIFEKYAKRPLLFAALLVLAHLSTYSYERRWIEFGRKLANCFRPALR